MFLQKYFTLKQWILVVCIVFSPLFSNGQTNYIKRYKPLADSLSTAAEIPTSIILGVAALESGFGTSRNAKLLNNHFGVKGKNNLWKTKRKRSLYKQYVSVKASYIDFVRIITNKKFYTTLKGNTDYKAWITAISKSGYSEKPTIWSERITAIIIKYKLETQ